MNRAALVLRSAVLLKSVEVNTHFEENRKLLKNSCLVATALLVDGVSSPAVQPHLHKFDPHGRIVRETRCCTLATEFSIRSLQKKKPQKTKNKQIQSSLMHSGNLSCSLMRMNPLAGVSCWVCLDRNKEKNTWKVVINSN